jgi:hypothetical protein
MPDDAPANDQSSSDKETATTQPEVGASTAQLQPGDRIGHYVIRQRIGEGGFAVVYAAEQTEPMGTTSCHRD